MSELNNEQAQRINNDLLGTIKKAFEDQYLRFSLENGEPDTPMARVGYYNTAIRILLIHPLSNREIQNKMLDYLEHRKQEFEQRLPSAVVQSAVDDLRRVVMKFPQDGEVTD